MFFTSKNYENVEQEKFYHDEFVEKKNRGHFEELDELLTKHRETVDFILKYKKDQQKRREQKRKKEEEFRAISTADTSTRKVK
jgi:hypothetical protein